MFSQIIKKQQDLFPFLGTSWLQQIVYLLVKGENDEATKNLTADQVN